MISFELVLALILCNAVFFASFAYYYRRFDDVLLSPNLWMLVFAVALANTLPGTYYYAFGGEMMWGLEQFLSDSTKLQVLIEFQLVWAVIFFLVALFRPLTNFRFYQRVGSVDSIAPSGVWGSSSFSHAILFFGVLFTLAPIVFLDSVPLIVSITEGYSAGSISKGEFVASGYNMKIPLVGYLTRYFPLLAVFYFFDIKLRTGRSSGFYILFLSQVLFGLLVLIKGQFVPIFIGCLYLYIDFLRSQGRSISLKFVGMLFLILLLSILPVTYLLNSDDGLIDLAIRLFGRFFVVQMEGAFLIRELYSNPELGALLNGFPLISMISPSLSFDPAADIVGTLLPSAQGWVNMNSSFVGQGYVMFGHLYTIICPMIILLNIILLSILSNTFAYISGSPLAKLILVTCAIYFPFNTNFSILLYGKSILAFIVIAAFLIFLRLLLGFLVVSTQPHPSVRA